MDDSRNTQRQPINVQRTCSVGIITFKQLEWTSHKVRITDLCKNGVGIESDNKIEPGFAWFKERVGGYRGGVVMWSRKQGDGYRAGVRFLPLTHAEERFVHEQTMLQDHHKPRRIPEEIIESLIGSLTRGGH